MTELRFWLEYQPRFCAKTGAVVSVEALARAETAGQRVSPAEFIPALEASGAITDFTYQVLLLAALEVGPVARRLRTLRGVAVNVSPVSFLDPLFAAQFAACRHALPVTLECELTETACPLPPATVLDNIRQLDAAGAEVALDDFGTGASNMHYISESVTTLKIDRSFVSGIGKTKAKESVVRSIVALARENGMRTVAEGVETEEQRQFVCEAGCDELQGFLLARPMSATDLVRRFG